ncbi:TorF family putative porin [Roseococcus sp. YIM B11640]|uniref:TorF family putative porin n=1 Tax=Roseococcus sp. YIM B11640 TaxID=3133973 RepID=UPI003C7B3953
MRKLLLALTAAAGLSLGAPAQAQVAIGETGLTATITGTVASDYLFRGISQTRSRIAYQSSVELAHASGFYVGGFISNVRFAYTDARQEVDVFGGFRFSLADFNFDVGVQGYLYPGYSRAPGTYNLDFFEGYLKATREIGPVNLLGAINVSPNYFGQSGTGVYLEGGADWKTGIWDVTLGGRIGYQWIERNVRFGTPDYAWWSIAVSRDFAIPNIGTITASVGYYDTSISRSDCIYGTAQDICNARAMGYLTFKF